MFPLLHFLLPPGEEEVEEVFIGGTKGGFSFALRLAACCL